MMRIALLCLALAGCAAQPQMTREQRAMQASDAQVCEGVFFGPPDTAAIGRNEAARRGINCMQYQQAASALYQQRMARQQAADNAMGDLSRQLLTPRPAMNCTTVNNFGILNTVCR